MTDGRITLAEHGRERDRLLERIEQVLTGDERVGAAWMSGSLGRGSDDAWSDLDLHVAINDAQYEAFLAERPILYASVGRSVLSQPDMASWSMPEGRFNLVMYEGCLEVDWNVGPVGKATRTSVTRLLFDHVGIPVVEPPLRPEERRVVGEKWLIFFWAMAPIAVKYCGRGNTRRAVQQIALLTDAITVLWRLLYRPDGPNPNILSTNRLLEPDLEARLPHFGATIDSVACLAVIRALCLEIETLHTGLTDLGVADLSEAAAEVFRLIAMAQPLVHESVVNGVATSIAAR
ncbi:MAG TPA: hypothetical protein VMW65_00900 [Chloroflexota bacterium]|nr:hypothetical protein [Chloroflexota bacterium]